MKRCLRCEARFDAPGWACPECGFAPEQRDGIVMFAPELAGRSEGFEPEAFDTLARTEESSFWFRARNALVLDLMRAHFPDARTVFEVGCGTGFVLRALDQHGWDASGSDLHPSGLVHARERVGARELLQMDARQMPFDAAFDVVAAFDVLEHVEEDVDVLREMRRSVRPGGGILVSVPQHPSLWAPIDDYAHHVRRYRRRELLGKARAAGFDVLRVTSFVSSLLPVMALSRWRQRRSDAELDPTAELSLPPTLDRLLERVLDAERAAIRRGVSLPSGGSLVLAARAPA